MWNLGRSKTHTSGEERARHSHDAAYASRPHRDVLITVEQGQPSRPSRTHANPHSTIHHSVSSSQDHHQHSTTAHSRPQRDVVITVEQGGQSHHHSHSHRPSGRHAHSQSPHRTSDTTRPSRPHSEAVQPQHYVQPERPPVWQYSRCTGTRKALCIGINYLGSENELQGCINDARAAQRFLIEHKYKPENIMLLTDDASSSRQRPTRQNILAAMRWLVKGARQDDALFFHYSGHGSQAKDRNGDEMDGWDEAILPSDFRDAGVIIDDEMHEIMVNYLPIGCRLTALFDSCHSGSVLDLPYLYHSDGRVKGSQTNLRARKAKRSAADVITLSGCKDSGTSADVVQAGYAAGAMSHSFIETFTQKPEQTYAELLRSVRRILRERYKQKPQLSSSHRINTNLKFLI